MLHHPPWARKKRSIPLNNSWKCHWWHSFLFKYVLFKINDTKKFRSKSSSFHFRNISAIQFHFYWGKKIKQFLFRLTRTNVDIFVCIEIPWGYCRCDMLIVCIQQKKKRSLIENICFVLNSLQFHHVTCLSSMNICLAFIMYFHFRYIMVDWLYSIRQNIYKYQNIRTSIIDE